LVVSVGFVSACGNNSTNEKPEQASQSYCATLKASASLVTSFTAADEPDFSTFDDFVGAAERLESQAPSDLKDDWAVLVDSLHGFQVGLQEQGISAAEYGKLVDDFDNLSDSDSDKVTAVISKMAALSSDKAGAALTAIDKQATSKCKVDLTTDE